MINEEPRHWEWNDATRAERQVIILCWILLWPLLLGAIIWAYLYKLWQREQIIKRFRADPRIESIHWDGEKFIVVFKNKEEIWGEWPR